MKTLTTPKQTATQYCLSTYGMQTCQQALVLQQQGEGQSTISIYTGIEFRRVPSAIKAALALQQAVKQSE